MSLETFEDWAARFQFFRDRSRSLLAIPVASEITELHRESQLLEPMFDEAQEHAAEAVAFYYAAKMREMQKLLAQGWPKSAVDSVGKAAAHRELRERERSERIVEVIKSRSIKVAQALKLITPAR